MNSTFDLSGRRALVTAASRGIGRGIARTLSRSGAAVVVNYLASVDAARSLVTELEGLGVRAAAVRGDVGDADEAARVVHAAAYALGGALDLVVNNHGPFALTPLASGLSPQEFDALIRGNLSSAYYVTHAALPAMLEAGRGVIVNIGLSSTTESLDGAPHVAPYAVAKAGLVTLTKSLAAELAPKGVRVAMVAPGLIDNGHLPEVQKRWMEERVPAGRLGTPEEVGAAVAFLASEHAAYASGAVLSVAGGWHWGQDRSTAHDTAGVVRGLREEAGPPA